MNPPDVVDRLVSENQPLVSHFAMRWRLLARIAQLEWNDLISAGKIGLSEAARRYDPAKAELSMYARFWIEKSLPESVERTGSGCRCLCSVA